MIRATTSRPLFRGSRRAPRDTPAAVLAQGFVRGAADAAEYASRLRVLGHPEP